MKRGKGRIRPGSSNKRLEQRLKNESDSKTLQKVQMSSPTSSLPEVTLTHAQDFERLERIPPTLARCQTWCFSLTKVWSAPEYPRRRRKIPWSQLSRLCGKQLHRPGFELINSTHVREISEEVSGDGGKTAKKERSCPPPVSLPFPACSATLTHSKA